MAAGEVSGKIEGIERFPGKACKDGTANLRDKANQEWMKRHGLTEKKVKKMHFEDDKSKEYSWIRLPVSGKAGDVWEFRDDIDLYTLRSRAETTKAEVDHIIEVQVHEAVVRRAFEKAPLVARTRSAVQSAYATVVNDAPVLNVTSKQVNKAKEGPFRAFLNRLRDGRLRARPIADFAPKTLKDDGTWARIEEAVVTTWDDTMSKKIREEVSNAAAATALIDEMTDVIGKMDLS